MLILLVAAAQLYLAGPVSAQSDQPVDYQIDKGPHIDPKVVETDFKYGAGINSPNGDTDVRAALDGVVYRYSLDPSNNATNLGRFVDIKHTLTGSDGRQYEFFSSYSLLSEMYLRPGQAVGAGDLVGKAGPSGPLSNAYPGATMVFAIYSLAPVSILASQAGSSPYLRFGVYWYNPVLLLQGASNGQTKLTETVDTDSYARTALDSLMSAVRTDLQKSDSEDWNYGFNKYVVSAKISEYPSPLTAAERVALSKYVTTNNLPATMNRLYGSHLYLQQTGLKVVFFFQETILSYLRKEVSPGTTVDLYLISGFYSGQLHAFCLFVNDFRRGQMTSLRRHA
jgi:Peptidase family M23